MKVPILYILGLVVLAVASAAVAALMMTGRTVPPASAAQAHQTAEPATGPCNAEVAHVTTWIKETGNDEKDMKPWFDADIADVKSIAGGVNVSKLTLQSTDYHIASEHTNKGGIATTQNVLRGTAILEIIPANQAAAIAEALTGRGYKSSVDGNSYKVLTSEECRQLNVTN